MRSRATTNLISRLYGERFLNSRTQFGDRKRLWDNIGSERFDIVGALRR